MAMGFGYWPGVWIMFEALDRYFSSSVVTLPDWLWDTSITIPTVFLFLSALAFFPYCWFFWAYDLTPRGLEKTSPLEKHPADASPKPDKPKPDKPKPTPASALVLEGSRGKPMSIRIRTRVGKSNVTQFGEEAQFWANVQFILDKQGDGWVVTHNAKAPNETLLNGKTVTGTKPLKDGDVLAVGKESDGIIRLPLKVQIG